MPAQRSGTPGTTAPGEPHWIRSSYSTGMNNCVEAARPETGRTAVRDSKERNGPALHFSDEAWSCFLSLVRDGESGR